MMGSVWFSLLCAIFLATVSPISATAASTQIFPSLRKKRREEKHSKGIEAQAQVEPVAQVEPSKSDEVPSKVPDPVDVGADGFPQLPAVGSMLKEASGTLKTVSSQASTLQAKMVEAQLQSESKMAKQKAAFEEKLKQQEQRNRMVIAANANITTEIKTLQGNNAALRKRAHDVQESNQQMRKEIHMLQARLGSAKDFTTQSLTSTDDSKNSLLEVLKVSGKHRRPHQALVEVSSKKASDDDDDDESSGTSDDSSDSDNDDDDSDEGTSLLSVSMKVRRSSAEDSFESPLAAAADVESVDSAVVSTSDPKDLLSVLAKDVANLAQEEKASEKQLKALFIRDFRAGAKRHQALLAQQKRLLDSRSSLLALQAKLKDAEAHLEGTQAKLQSSLHGLGHFLQKLAHFAMAPRAEVPHLMEVLPTTVGLPVKTAKSSL